MELTATASKTVRNKNLLLILMVLVGTALFAYDGFIGYPESNNKLVKAMQAMAAKNDVLVDEDAALLSQWPPGGWSDASTDLRNKIDNLIKRKHAVDGWKTETDISIQRAIFVGLVVCTIAAVWWFFRCQRRRITADDQSLFPTPDTSVPWASIIKVDNCKWKKTGIVDIQYKDTAGNIHSAELDDYLHDNLVPILEELSQRATNAEFINPPEEAPAAK